MKHYESPEFELTKISFENILDDYIRTSENESGGEGHNDDNSGEL